jgi:hypothetical protein
MRKSRASDIQLPRPSFLPEPTTVLFSYELGEDNLRMLHALQHREGLPSLKAAFIECLGIVTTLVEKTEAGYEIVSRKNEIIEPLEIDSLLPRSGINVTDERNLGKTIEISVDKELEMRQGLSPERAQDLRDHHLYKASPLPDGEWIGRLEYKVTYPPIDSGDIRVDCHFTFVREHLFNGKFQGHAGEKYRLTAYKSIGGMASPKRGMVDFSSLDIVPGMKFRLGTRTGPKLTGRYAGCPEWGYWNFAEREDVAQQLEEAAEIKHSEYLGDIVCGEQLPASGTQVEKPSNSE